MDLREFFDMGGYALYVWTAYGMALAVLLANLVAARRRSRQVTLAVKRFLHQQSSPR